jgi:hypothetical protein
VGYALSEPFCGHRWLDYWVLFFCYMPSITKLPLPTTIPIDSTTAISEEKMIEFAHVILTVDMRNVKIGTF